MIAFIPFLTIVAGLLVMSVIALACEVARLRDWSDVLTERIYRLQGTHDCGAEECYGPPKKETT